MELQEFPGTFAEYNQAMLETKVQMAEQATKDAEWIAVQEKLIEKIRAEATYIDNPAKGRQLKAVYPIWSGCRQDSVKIRLSKIMDMILHSRRWNVRRILIRKMHRL